MLKSLHIILTLAMLLALSACGNYRPLYAKGLDGASVTSGLASISVPEQRSRAGQLLRNELLDGLGGKAVALYSLRLVVTERTIDVMALTSSVGARKRYNLAAHFELSSEQSDKVLNAGDSFSNVEFDAINVPVSDLSAADNAKLRAAKELGQDIKLRLAAFLSSQKS